MGTRLQKINNILLKYGIYAALHIFIILVCIWLVVCISMDTFNDNAHFVKPHSLRIQFWVCMLFLGDFFLEFFLSPDKKQYWASRWAFFLVAVPWLPIFNLLDIHFSPEVTYLLRFIPLIRGGYALAIVVGWFTSSKASSLFFSYLMTLIATIYFASLAFYMFEHGVNNLVDEYSDALWWACMDATTVGSDIVAITPIGRVLSVMLAAFGMMMFPIFTVYVTDKIKTYNRNPDKSILSIPTSDTPDSSSGNNQPKP